MKQNKPLIITIQDAAKLANVSTRTIYRWIAEADNAYGDRMCWETYVPNRHYNLFKRPFIVMVTSPDHNGKIYIERKSFLYSLKEAGRI